MHCKLNTSACYVQAPTCSNSFTTSLMISDKLHKQLKQIKANDWICTILKVQTGAGFWSHNAMKSQNAGIDDKYRNRLQIMFESKSIKPNQGTNLCTNLFYFRDIISFWIREACESASFMIKAPNFTVPNILQWGALYFTSLKSGWFLGFRGNGGRGVGLLSSPPLAYATGTYTFQKGHLC